MPGICSVPAGNPRRNQRLQPQACIGGVSEKGASRGGVSKSSLSFARGCIPDMRARRYPASAVRVSTPGE